MLAFAWHWSDCSSDSPDTEGERLGASLCAGIGGVAGSWGQEALRAAYRPIPNDPVRARSWRPAALADGRIALFHGWIDNAAAIAAELGSVDRDPAALYGAAVARWGQEADRRIVGEYCALIADPAMRHLRLSRSPLRAPPLHYAHGPALAAAASVPRALFAAGIERRFNEVRSADSSLINFTDPESTWFEGVAKVPLGATVELAPGQERRLVRYYDLLACPDIRPESDEACIARVQELLAEGVAACLAGSRNPGSTLSSGLDSSQVVVHALRQLPEGRKLPTFTFHPEAGWDGVVEPEMNGNERPMVEAFAAMHPRIEPHFTDNRGYGHDHRWAEFFHLTGGAPSGLCNMYVYHGLFEGARQAGCDRLLIAEWGNYTFSDKGEWAYVELLLKGRLRQYWLALKHHPNDSRTMWRKFLALTVMPLLPQKLWRVVKRLVHPEEAMPTDRLSPLSAAYRERSGAERRYREAGLEIDRYQPWNRRAAQRLLFQNNDAEGSEVNQGFEQIYDIPMRDPTAYRPLVEYCLGLPVEMFVRDGIVRWLAKQMARGIMSEEQRINRLNGRWDSDWHLRIGRKRAEYLAELDRIADDPRLAEMFDLPRLRAALEDFPEATTLDMDRKFAIEFAVPRAMLAARFIRWVEGRNS